MSDDKRRERPQGKKSWREIDAQRDRSGGGARRTGEVERKLQDAQKSKQYRAALDALFEKGGFDKVAKALGREEEKPPEEKPAPVAPVAGPSTAPAATDSRAVLRKKIVEAVGRDEIRRALDRYLAQWPLPDDWEVLEQALEDERRIEDALGKLEAMVAREKPRRARTLIGKLRYLEETSSDDEMRKRAGTLRGKLG